MRRVYRAWDEEPPLDEEKTFRDQLKRAFRLLTNPLIDPWEIGNALFGRLTQGLKAGLIAVD